MMQRTLINFLNDRKLFRHTFQVVKEVTPESSVVTAGSFDEIQEDEVKTFANSIMKNALLERKIPEMEFASQVIKGIFDDLKDQAEDTLHAFEL
jgi:hypothetical protein